MGEGLWHKFWRLCTWFSLILPMILILDCYYAHQIKHLRKNALCRIFTPFIFAKKHLNVSLSNKS